jgi:hypothetical protein
MSQRCAACGQHNPDSARFCEFCKAVFGKPAPPKKAPAPAVVPAAGPVFVSRGWGTPSVMLIAIMSGAGGFALRQFLPVEEPKVPPPVAVMTPPPPPPKKAPAPSPPPPVVHVETKPIPVVDAPAPRPNPAPAVAALEPPRPVELKHFRVPYQPYEGSAQRIIVPVTFNGHVTAPMLIDTGAPGILISPRLAAKIGVLREGDARLVTMAGGIGGKQTAALVVLDSLSVGEATTEFVPATVTDSISQAFEGLVGMDFIGGYQIEIDTHDHVLVLNEQPKSARAPAGHDEHWWRRTFALLSGQRTQWKNVFALAQERAAASDVSAGTGAEELKRLVAFAESQNQQAEQLATRLERYAAENSVPLEWRR